MPGDRLDDLHLVTFHIEAEVVDSRPIDSEQNRVERETLDRWEIFGVARIDNSAVVGPLQTVVERHLQCNDVTM